MMYRIEIWQYKKLSEVYESEDIQNILSWYKWYWYESYEYGLSVFHVYKNGVKLELNELWELGFFN